MSAPSATAQSVAEMLSAQIMDRLDLGAQLPSESDLAARFEVSRVTVREALKILAGQGLVSLSRGRRATVTQPDGAMFGAFLRSLIHSDPRAMFDLLQVRRSLEVQAVTLACRNASRSGLAAVDAALDAMRDAARAMPDDGGDEDCGRYFDQADVKFHQAMALAGGNRVLTFLFEAMESALLEVFEGSRRGQMRSRAALIANCGDHGAILDHVRARDERAAAEAMLALIARAESNLRAAFSGV
jgi:GntR family transcriptional regulator, transcriptional repressor for pyruvate dehydrogenase complex